MYEQAIGLIAGAIGFLAFVPYILEAIQRKTRPNRATWIIWAILGIIIAASYWASGARETVWAPAAYAVGITAVALISVKYGEGGWTALDIACLLGAGAGLIVWWLTSEPEFSLYLTIAIDAIGAIPTIRKSYERPESESRSSWLMFLAANTLNLFAIREWSAAIASYPVYVFLLDIVILALLFRPSNAGSRNQKRKPKAASPELKKIIRNK